MKKKIIIKILLVSFIISLLIAPLRGGYITICEITGFELSSIVGFIIYYFLTYFIYNKYHERIEFYKILVAILLGASIISFPMHVIYFKSTVVSLLEYLIHLLAILGGAVFFKISKIPFKILFGIISLMFAIWMSVPGYEMWLNKINFGTFTGTLSEKTAYDFKFQTSRGESTSVSDFKKEYILIDCWYTYCGVCYQEFPKVQELYNKYKNSGSVEIFTLHSRIKEESETFSTGEKILKGRGYTIPAFSIDIDDEILKKLGVNAYPTVLIFDKEGELIFRGRIEGAGELIDELVNN